MSTTLIYYAESSPDRIVTQPFAKPTASSRLGWDTLAKRLNYHPYLIRCIDPTLKTYKFKYVDCVADRHPGDDYGTVTHTVDATDFKLVLPMAPSTMPDAASIAAGRSYGFLFLSDKYIDHADLSQDGVASGGGTGKHPIGAALALAPELKQLRHTIRKMCETMGPDMVKTLAKDVQETIHAAQEGNGIFGEKLVLGKLFFG